MRTRIVVSFLLVVAVSLIAIGVVKSRQTVAAHTMASTQSPVLQQRADIIDGSVHPELIPDSVAYSILFRLIADRKTEAEKDHIRDYIRMMGIGKARCKTCDGPENNADFDALIAAAEDFNQRVKVLDHQAADIKDRNWPDPSPAAVDQLNRLQLQNESLVTEMMGNLHSRLSPEGLEKVRQHIAGRMKSRIKIAQNPDPSQAEMKDMQH